MMTDSRRILLCIGCDNYITLSSLSGAHKDAQNMYDLLCSRDNGDYPESSSRLLLSPTCSELDSALSKLLPANEQVDTLTIFFAGHGGVIKGTYYLCLTDTVEGKFSTSAYSLSRLFEIINEASPAQCNIIIDACESGGLVSNLATLLKPELLGMANTSGISIFATSAAKEFSLDTQDGGVGTTQLLRVLKGEIIVQNNRPYLDLVEAGRAAANLIVEEALRLTESMDANTFTAQTPVVWGLNLFGQSRFSKNPAYDVNQPPSLHSIVSISSRSAAGATISEASGILWSLFYEPPENLTPTKIFNTLNPIMQTLGNESDVVRFISGIEIPLNEKILGSPDSFASIQLTATLVSLLVQWCGQSGLAETKINEMATRLIEQLRHCLEDLYAELNEFEHALAFEGLADFFYLPIRISKLLGWCGGGLLICELLGTNYAELKRLTENLALKILDVYEACIFVISDAQSPYILTFLLASLRFGARDIGEQFFGLYIAQLFKDNANFARASLEPELAYDFLKIRKNGELTCTSPMVAHPSESLSVLLMMAKFYELEDTVDPYLSKLDHVSNVVFIPNSHTAFAQQVIEQGRNHSFQIGHGIWSVNDFASRWNAICGTQLAGDLTLDAPAIVAGALCVSLLFPDRTPWFLLRPPPDSVPGLRA